MANQGRRKYEFLDEAQVARGGSVVGDDAGPDAPDENMPNDPRVLPSVGTPKDRIISMMGRMLLEYALPHMLSASPQVHPMPARNVHFLQEALGYLGALRAPFADSQMDAPTIAAVNDWISRPFAQRYFPLGALSPATPFPRPWFLAVGVEAGMRGWTPPDLTPADLAVLPPSMQQYVQRSAHGTAGTAARHEAAPDPTPASAPAPTAPPVTPPPPIAAPPPPMAASAAHAAAAATPAMRAAVQSAPPAIPVAAPPARTAPSVSGLRVPFLR